nr:hypothetical protein P5626_10615 [Bacillus subtilis]WGD80839.1 hypothetical protein P5659_16380 [Bacillus subtilis]WGD82888.1 hypothetical protein P5664_12400 [Bacillus subtilis]
MKILKEEAEAGKELDKEKLNKRIIDLTKEAYQVFLNMYMKV